MRELASRNTIAAFTDPVSILVHDKDVGAYEEDKLISEELRALQEYGMC